jgi:heme/copper-type cytochrome/quinol oxidase subunit 1
VDRPPPRTPTSTTRPTAGQPILWQNLFWFFGHPEVYILALPYFGIVTEVLATMSKKPVFGYKGMIGATLSIGALSMGVWAHHMYTTGAVLLPFFAALSLLIAVPTGIKFFNWIGTMWRGTITLNTAMLFCSASSSCSSSAGSPASSWPSRCSTSSSTTPTSSSPTSTT